MDNKKLAYELIKLAKELTSRGSQKVIKVDWNSSKSIRDAERMKTRLENQGYKLVETIGGTTTSKLVYRLDED